ncbi:hypothetical protein N7448_007861 [Penicillium atrosanguineum]|nr:hypothetical protein N7448_007861 [Penicillium atrosanguineum]KAJ5147287.1 hypothetical protein N7526_000639 [Penicillium atrosanguineum]
MADPYNPYTSYSTPTPGGQPYNNTEPQHDPNYPYPPQQNPYQLAPESYQPTADRTYTPVGQPDHRGPISPAPQNPNGKIPENASYYGHPDPASQPRYTPSSNPHTPSVYVSDSANPRDSSGEMRTVDDDPEGERGIGSSLAGGAAGYYFGHKKDHGLLGALGGAIIGNIMEHKVKVGVGRAIGKMMSIERGANLN